jgi:hypothetical protein
VIIDTSNAQDMKALELCAVLGTMGRTPSGAYLIPSSRGSARYRVNSDECTCPAGTHDRICYHRKAVQLAEALNAASQRLSRVRVVA